jgi:predicted DCC family thiol-disulfide oxidoreductase YuxK
MTTSPSTNPQEPACDEQQADKRPVVFYDGDCPLCRREIAHYQRIDGEGRLRWVDAAGEPDILTGYELTLEAAMAELHVLDADGQWQRGVDAFLVIWAHLPRYRWLVRLVSFPGLHGLLSIAYRHFAVWRNRRRCSANGCQAASGTRTP